MGVHLCLLPVSLSPQETEEELVVNLAAGRVLIYVAKDAIVVAAAGEPVEAGAHPPLVTQLGRRRVAILLGAVEWVSPASGRAPVRLDAELPRLAGESARAEGASEPDRATDIEAVGVALLERLRPVAAQLHRKVDFQPDETLVELLLVNYAEEYGPEVWSLRYRMAQEVLRGEYYRTRVLRPSHTQLYPPEKGEPRTLIEVRYPADARGPALLDLLSQNDARLARMRSGEPQVARAAERLARGESHKASVDDALAFLRAALTVVVPAEAKLALGVIHQEKGLDWVLAPPQPPKDPNQKPRAPGAPTLRKK